VSIREEAGKKLRRSREEAERSEIHRVIKIGVLHFKKKEIVFNLIHFD